MKEEIGSGSRGDYTWSVLAEPDGHEQYLDAALVRADGRRHTSGMGGPVTWPGRPLNVYAGRADGFPLVVLARSDRATDLEIRVDGVTVEPVWTRARDGVSYLLHLIPEAQAVASVEVLGRTGSGTVREGGRLP